MTVADGAAVERTPSGLDTVRFRQASDVEVRSLFVWHAGKAGDDDGRPWWPNAVRRLSFDARLRLAADPRLDAAWEVRERRRVQASPAYMLTAYGHMQDEEGGAPVPFDAWPPQIMVMDTMSRVRLLLVLKARQLGLTWLALHYAVWLMAFKPETVRARVLALSKTQVDARKLLTRSRRINLLLPPFLRLAEDQDTKRSNDRFKLEARGEMASLPGTPDAARSEQAALLLMDEGAFYRNRGFTATWTAARSTVGKAGQAFIISTGNGPPEAPSDGQGFARLWTRGRAGQGGWRTVFLPASTDPARTPEWRAREIENYLNPEDFEAEHPETEEQALAGVSGIKVYLPAGINAAELLGRELDGLLLAGRLPEPAGGRIELMVDWGELTHMLAVWPLEGGGMYVLPGEWAPPAGPGIEPGHSTRMMLRQVRECQRSRESTGLHDPWPLIAPPYFDAAGVQSMKTFLATCEGDLQLLRQLWTVRRRGVQKVPTVKVAFGDYKNVGKDYLKYLFRRTAQNKPTGVVGISPRNVVLLRQLRGLEVMDDGSGRIAKGDDHGPDALIAGSVHRALTFLGREGLREEQIS